MLKRLLHHPLMLAFLAGLGSLYIRLIFHTTRWRFENLDWIDPLCNAHKPFIVCFWHERLSMAALGWRHKNPFYMIISSSRDGQLISRVVAPFGIQTIQGSSRRGGGAALKAMVTALKQGSVVGITPDGPKGPRRKVQPGILMAAYMAQVPIFPFSYSTSRGHVFASWDRFLLPFPFGRGIMAFGDPLPPPATVEDFPLWQENLEVALTALTDRIDHDLNRTP